MEAEMICLLHHSMCSTGPHHLSWSPLKPSMATLYREEHGRPRLHAMRSHPWATEQTPVWSAADLIAVGDLHTQQV